MNMIICHLHIISYSYVASASGFRVNGTTTSHQPCVCLILAGSGTAIASGTWQHIKFGLTSSQATSIKSIRSWMIKTCYYIWCCISNSILNTYRYSLDNHIGHSTIKSNKFVFRPHQWPRGTVFTCFISLTQFAATFPLSSLWLWAQCSESKYSLREN